MTCFNAVLVAPDRLLVGTDGACVRYIRGRRASVSVCKKVWRCGFGPMFAGGRGEMESTRFMAWDFWWHPLALHRSPGRLLDHINRRWRSMMRYRRSIPAEAGETDFVIAGWSRRRREMVIHAFHLVSLKEGFEPRPLADGGAYVAPYDRSIDRLTTPATVPAMFNLLGAQCALFARRGYPAGPPLTVLEITPGRVERHVDATPITTPRAPIRGLPFAIGGARGLGRPP